MGKMYRRMAENRFIQSIPDVMSAAADRRVNNGNKVRF